MHQLIHHNRRGILFGFLAGLSLLAIGGCPNVQNGVVDAFQTTAVTALNSTPTTDPTEMLTRGVIAAALGGFLNHFRVQIGN